jgi:iron complex outermembrane receptor protein
MVPKAFLTYELDDLAEGLRDTSIALGVSKIWNPMPFCYGCGRDTPTTAWAEPEHGIGYDFIFTRRVYKDISFKAGYSYYSINDYVASNRSYSEYTPGHGNTVPPGMEYKDLYINLEEMLYQGIEIGFNGHITGDLSFYLSYVYTDLESQGGEPAGEEAEDERAKHRVNAGLRYNLFDNTLLMLDCKYQSEQTQQNSEEIGPEEYIWYTVDMDAYTLFDFAIEQTLLNEYGGFKDVTAKFYINNLLDEEYVNSRGYPMTDQTFGISLGCRF